LIVKEVFVVFRSQECTLVMIEPPCDLRRGRVLEIDNRVFVAGEFSLIEKRSGAMKEADVFKTHVIANSFRIETRKECCRRSPVETPVVKENPDLQYGSCNLIAGFLLSLSTMNRRVRAREEKANHLAMQRAGIQAEFALNDAATGLLTTILTHAVDLEGVARGFVMMLVADLLLQTVDFRREKLNRASAVGANHMVMAAPILLVLVTSNAIMKCDFARQSTLRQ